MLTWREKLLKPFRQADAVVFIDSDPGGYPHSTNKEFVGLLMRYRQLFDKLRPGGIELVYWSWAGWPAYGRYYATGNFAPGTEQEFVEAFTMLKERNPEPWGLAPSGSAAYAQKVGLQSRVINFNYNAIEEDPVFPMTNFGGSVAYGAGDLGTAGGSGQRPDPLSPVAEHLRLRPRSRRFAVEGPGLRSICQQPDCRPRRVDRVRLAGIGRLGQQPNATGGRSVGAPGQGKARTGNR